MHRLRYALGFCDPDPKVDRQEGRHTGMVRIGNDAFRRWGMAPALADPRQIVSAILHMDRKPPSGQRGNRPAGVSEALSIKYFHCAGCVKCITTEVTRTADFHAPEPPQVAALFLVPMSTKPAPLLAHWHQQAWLGPPHGPAAQASPLTAGNQ
ncbi:hypothetical protein GCM10028796_00020 [Ramlibacter monticola]|uniref:Uncharacterized protein n=1 Tax=Ramlibacter monticola TaxID=1926872 RepID=A0A936Z199_9BURK|nr:hypothetical protein [Ramlibacter monticola]MBL0391702.1 hypothetical protein [Ramlibacter monticola]